MWAPELINNDPLWQEGRGPNSIQILSWLAQAFVLTGEQQYLTGLETLMLEPVRYDANLLNQKMSQFATRQHHAECAASMSGELKRWWPPELTVWLVFVFLLFVVFSLSVLFWQLPSAIPISPTTR